MSRLTLKQKDDIIKGLDLAEIISITLNPHFPKSLISQRILRVRIRWGSDSGPECTPRDACLFYLLVRPLVHNFTCDYGENHNGSTSRRLEVRFPRARAHVADSGGSGRSCSAIPSHAIEYSTCSINSSLRDKFSIAFLARHDRILRIN